MAYLKNKKNKKERLLGQQKKKPPTYIIYDTAYIQGFVFFHEESDKG